MQLLTYLRSAGRWECAGRAQSSRPALFPEQFSGGSSNPAQREGLQGDVGCSRAGTVQLDIPNMIIPFGVLNGEFGINP